MLLCYNIAGLMCRFPTLNVNQGVIIEKSFETAFCKCSEMLNLHVFSKMAFWRNICIGKY